MIVKSFEVNKINFLRNTFYLFYGENSGFKEEIIKKNFEEKYKKNIFRYEEKEILENKENFFSSILSQSFFENEKLIIILRATDKFLPIIEEIIDKKISDIKLVLISNILEKKSKLRNYFEKKKNLICVPFYSDTNLTLNKFALNFFKNKNIPISQETLNFLIERCKGSRQSLDNELSKIESYTMNKKKISIEEISKLTNLSENYNVSELADNCLAKNSKQIVKILNENNLNIEDTMLVIRSLLSKAKRLLKIQEQISKEKNIEKVISSFKPTIFWKDKDIVKQQISHWPLKKVELLISNISKTELLLKKYSSNSVNILSDFIIVQSAN